MTAERERRERVMWWLIAGGLAVAALQVYLFMGHRSPVMEFWLRLIGGPWWLWASAAWHRGWIVRDRMVTL